MFKGMSKILIFSVFVLGVILMASGCGFIKGWKLDYGRAKAHIEESDLAERGKEFVGKKVLVRGVVNRVDFSEEGIPKVILSYGTECHFGKMKKMAEAIRVGESVIISGILDESKDGELFLNPAIQRDPKASFKP